MHFYTVIEIAGNLESIPEGMEDDHIVLTSKGMIVMLMPSFSLIL